MLTTSCYTFLKVLQMFFNVLKIQTPYIALYGSHDLTATYFYNFISYHLPVSLDSSFTVVLLILKHAKFTFVVPSTWNTPQNFQGDLLLHYKFLILHYHTTFSVTPLGIPSDRSMSLA